uniref:Small ribosomal subunit protein uS5 n=1 Tax=Otolemur garnettii TaxID=30611 RepID=H0XTV3_OTOGA
PLGCGMGGRAVSVEAEAAVFGPGSGCGWGWDRGSGACGGKAQDKEWMPVTKLGHSVKDVKIKSEEISLFSLPIKESIDFFLEASLKDEVLKITSAKADPGGWTTFKALVAIGDYNGHVLLGVPCFQEVATTTLSTISVQKGYWRNKISKPHAVPCKETGRCGPVLVHLIPAPRGTCTISAPVPKRLLQLASIGDSSTPARGGTATLGNSAKATFDVISKTYCYLTPELWKESVFTTSPYQKFNDHLLMTHTRVSLQRTQGLAGAIT